MVVVHGRYSYMLLQCKEIKMDKNYVFVFTMILFFFIISHINKSPNNQVFEGSEICFFASNVRKKKSEFRKKPKNVYCFSCKINEADHGLGCKKTKGASDPQFCRVPQDFRNCRSFKLSWTKLSNQCNRPLIPKFEFLLELCERATQKQSYNRHIAAQVLPAHQLQSSTEVKST